ncbi:MAG: GGDEF domain-containing protein [Butyrivibrio sp.]|nr:GGDEF domain-containing protein [Butyrivibrio sp.]
MKDYSYLKIQIADDSHLLVSADSKAYGIIKSDEYTSFENYVVPEYRENFLKKLEEADDTWFPARLMSDTNNVLYYIRAARSKDNSLITMILVSIDELLESHNKLFRTVATYKAQLELFDDVFFEYDPAEGTVNVYNADLAHFDAGVYSIEEFERLLCQNISERKQAPIKTFIGQMKAKTGRFNARVEANLASGDTSVRATILEGAYIYYYEGSEGVIGHIHLDNSRGRHVASSIKRDSLTGLVDKADIMRIAQERINERRIDNTTLAIIDIDFFKLVNDTYGHQVGDEVIKKVADIISTEVGSKGIAGRFGGDEFLVILYNTREEDDIRRHLRSIKNIVSASFADRVVNENMSISVSIGAATFSKDADNFEDLFTLADHCLYIAKEKGRNRYIIYCPEKHGPFEEIMDKSMSKMLLNDRGNLSYGDILLKMYDVTFHGSGMSPKELMDEFVVSFGLQHMGLFVGKPISFRYSTGPNRLRDHSSYDLLVGILNSDTKQRIFAGGDFIVLNRVDTLPPQAGSIKEFLKDAGIFSYIMIRFHDADEQECILTITSIGKYTQWNQLHFKYYRAFVDILAKYSLGSAEW